jgi:hypothetical protein
MGASRGRVTLATLIGLVVSVVLASPVSAVPSRTGASAPDRQPDLWWQYPEPSIPPFDRVRAPPDLQIQGETSNRASFVAPAVTQRTLFHVILEAHDLDGKTHQPTGASPDPRIANIIRKASTDAAVLLKNQQQALPATAQKGGSECRRFSQRSSGGARGG